MIERTCAGRVAVAVALVAIAAAPTAGDIGGCGQEAVPLDARKFFEAKARTDCSRCAACGIASATCELACEGGDPDATFPRDCVPLVHDGEVCLRALGAASCDDYAGYVADVGATTPTECAFCPEEAR